MNPTQPLEFGLFGLFAFVILFRAYFITPKVTVSKETTNITKPLKKDGFVDYAAALNERLSKDVLKENNAVVTLFQAFGHSFFSGDYRKEYFKRLGIPVPSEKRNYFEIIPYRHEDEELFDDFQKTLSQPWSEVDVPKIAKWLKKNDRASAYLTLVIARLTCV